MNNIRILEWNYEGIRSINNLSINLTPNTNPNHPFPVSFIMMPNGTGKTTTITLIRATLDGSATMWSPEAVRDFMPTPTVDKGVFSLKLLINNDLYWIFLNLDYINGTVKYQTSRTGKTGGLEDGLLLPGYIKDLFTTEFVKRFVFDAELPQEIINQDSQEAEKAIKYLYRIDVIGGMNVQIGEILKKHQQDIDNTNARTDRGLNRWKNIRDERFRKLKQLRDKKDALESEQIELNDELQILKDREDTIMRQDATIKEQKDENDRRLLECSGKIAISVQKILDRMKNPELISELMTSEVTALAENMRILKLPKTMSKQFFHELAESDNCICCRPIGPQEKEAILNNASNFLAEDQIGVMNSIKDNLRGTSFSNDIYDEIEALKITLTEREDLNAELRRLKVRLEDLGVDELTEIDKRRDEINNRLGEIKTELKDLTSRDNTTLTWTSNIPICQKELDEAINNIESITETVLLSKRAKKAKHYLNMIERNTLEKLKKRIILESNKKVEKVLPNELIEIDGIEGYLKLKGKKGASAGQTLGIAYSFIGSLFESSLYEFPFVIDSPSLALDLEVRREVSEALPRLFNQLILLVISSETNGFCDTFYEKPASEVQFITVKKTKGQQNAKIWYDKEVFKSFQQTEDEES
jgi:hypothetical protein